MSLPAEAVPLVQLSHGQRQDRAPRLADLPPLSGWTFLPVGFFARLPGTMVPLALLTHSVAVTGSYRAGGTVVAGAAVGAAIGSPTLGRTADRYGQRAVLLLAGVTNAATLMLLAVLGSPAPRTLVALAVLSGLTVSPVGGMARTRWMSMTGGRADSAMAYEGTIDEIAYVAGPALTGILAAAWSPGVALGLAGVLSVLAVGAFAVHPTHATVARRPARSQRPGVNAPEPRRTSFGALTSRLWVCLAGMACLGVFFASAQSALAVFSNDLGRPSAAGLLCAFMAVGSAMTSLAMAAVPARIATRTRLWSSVAGLLVGLLAMWLAGRGSPSLVGMIGGLLLTSLFVGPPLVTLYAAAGRRVSGADAATAMTLLPACVVTGAGAGAFAAGSLAQHFGVGGALLVAVIAVAMLGLVTRWAR